MGDVMQRGGGNLAKAVAEIAGCGNASGFDVRGFCAGPAAAVIAGREHGGLGRAPECGRAGRRFVAQAVYELARPRQKGAQSPGKLHRQLCGALVPDDGTEPVIRLDSVGKHSVAAGAAPQAITSALTFEPLTRLGLKLTDVDKYAPELHNAEITLPAGAGNVPEANFKMGSRPFRS